MCERHSTPEVAVVPAPGQAVNSRDHRCTSEIGGTPDASGRFPYTLRIAVFIAPPENNVYVDRWPVAGGGFQHQRIVCEAAPEPVLVRAFAAMQDSVNTYWNDKLFLDSRSPNVRGLSCRIELRKVDTAAEANLSITLLHRYTSPTPTDFRDFCMPGGSPVELERGEMVLAYPGTVYRARQPVRSPATSDQRAFNITFQNRRTSDAGSVDITQNVFAHELGHFLTLDHTCAHLVNAAGGNGSPAYCDGRARVRQEFLMSYGTNMHRNYARLWWSRLERHHYHCERTFRRRLVA